MSDVVISYAGENEATARQLADAVQREGYGVWRPEGGSDASTADAVTERIAGAKAVIVIWSDAAASSEWIRAEANVARGMKKLVQTSADGNPPPIPFDAAQVASISTWLGDDAHPGWTAIKAGLAGLAGVPAAPGPAVPVEPPVAAMPSPEHAAPIEPVPPVPEPGPVVEPESLSDPEPSAPAAASAAAVAREPESLSAPPAAKGPSGVLIVIILVVIAALVAAGAWFWMRSQPIGAPVAENQTSPQPAPQASAPAPTQPTVPTSPAPAGETFDRRAALSGSEAVTVRSAPSEIGFTVARINPGETFDTYRQSGDWWRVRTASGSIGYLPAASIRIAEPGMPPTATTQTGRPRTEAPPDRRAEPPRPRGPRIRKENSEVMEAFCQGAGRGTPQCRRFQRSNY